MYRPLQAGTKLAITKYLVGMFNVPAVHNHCTQCLDWLQECKSCTWSTLPLQLL